MVRSASSVIYLNYISDYFNYATSIIIVMRFLLTIFFFFLFINSVSAQISQGGMPLPLNVLKSTDNAVVEMPALQNEVLKQAVLEVQSADKQLKPFRFAHPFEVSLTPGNSGVWVKTADGFYCWRLKIRSRNAKSINLIFDDFKLPEGARLFIFNEMENHFLGAFTAFNNKPSGKFAVSPVLGDEITVQYEIPEKYRDIKHFSITKVNHDFVGILKASDRRPLGIVSGSCNIDINCDDWGNWSKVKNSVCRLIVDGREICTGVLINNTAENQKPYILSAAHCYDKWTFAETTVYTFNYESPFCAPLDGDPSNSISGAIMKAQYDTLDFALAELSLVPPPAFRPYFAGWDRTSNIPDSTITIHHPQGDVKKVSLDADPPEISNFQSGYLDNGFFKILRWDGGVTEAGSSGGPLFNASKNVIGTLTGGVATCSNPVRDYFEMFSLSWDNKPDSAKQLKYWLDPLNSGEQVLNGNQFYENEDICGAFTNLSDNDSHDIISIVESNEFKGYWGGSNSVGISEFVERFSILGNEQLAGISLGIGKLTKVLKSSESEITIKVYNGGKLPGNLIYSGIEKIDNLVEDAMNFIGFNEIIEPADTFFVGFELSKMDPFDSIVVYQSLRPSYEENTLYLKRDNFWVSFTDANPSGKSMANIFELVACNIEDFSIDTPLVNNQLEILVYPNPANSFLTLECGTDISESQIAVYNLLGQEIKFGIDKINSRKYQLNLFGNLPGIYFVRISIGEKYISQKVSFVPG